MFTKWDTLFSYIAFVFVKPLQRSMYGLKT